MSYATCNGLPVTSGRVAIPRVGAWHADLALDGDAPVGELAITLGGLGFRGWARRSGTWGGQTTVRAVGGRGGLARTVAAQGFRDSQLSAVVDHVLRESGETLARDADQGALATALPWWSVLEAPAGAALAAVTQALGLVWRVTPSGEVWIGAETWPESQIDAEALAYSAASDVAEVYLPVPALLPGMTWQGRRVSYVEHAIEPERVRSRVWFER